MKSKIGAALFALVFAVGFGAGGAFGIAQLAEQLNGWWQARSWQAVAADVIETDLRVTHDEGTTFEVTARYRYELEGKQYEGTRIGFTGGSDNIGSWQQDRYAELRAAHRSGRTIEAWVDPKHPTRSVIDRSLRWNMVLFAIPFATLFPMVSLGALWVFVRILRTPNETEALVAPQLNENPQHITSDAHTALRARWLFALVWALFCFPMALIFVPETYGKSPTWLFVMIFPMAGVLMIWSAAARTLRLRRNGEVAIAIAPAQPRIGEDVIVTAGFDRLPASGAYRASLICEVVDTRGDSESVKTKWRQERDAHIDGQSTSIAFSPPAYLPRSQPAAGVYHRWRFALLFPDGKDARSFAITLNAAREEARSRDSREVDHRTIDAPARPVPWMVANISESATELRIDYNPASRRGSAFAALVPSILLGVIAQYLLGNEWRSSGATIVGWILAACALGLLWASIYLLTHRRSVAIAAGNVRVSNRWLFGAKRTEFAVADIRRLIPTISGSTTLGSTSYDHHRITAHLDDRRKIVLTNAIHDAGVAETLFQIFSRHLHTAAGRNIPSGDSKHELSNVVSTDGPDRSQTRRWFMLIVKVTFALMFAAFAWQFAAPFVETRRDAAARDLQVEAPRTAVQRLGKADRALFAAVDGAATDAVATALADGANVHAINAWGATPLLVATWEGSAEIVQLLLNAGSDVNFEVSMDNQYRGRTALMNAATGPNGALVDVLLARGADPQVVESHGWSAIHYAAHRDNLEALRAFQRHGIGLDLPSPVSRGETPLMIAACFGRIEAIRELIELGANPRARDRHGENAYGWAKYFNQEAAMEALREYR